MAVKKCCIMECMSCSTRTEDIGVTYHKFPKDNELSNIWLDVTKQTDTRLFVCSRHFRKSDFQIYKDSKYILKSDAAPSIFPWTLNPKLDIKMECDEDTTKSDDPPNETIRAKDTFSSEKDHDTENLEAIRNYIKEQEKVIAECELERKRNIKLKQERKEDKITDGEKNMNVPEEGKIIIKEEPPDTYEVATSVMEMILSGSEAKIEKNKSDKLKLANKNVTTGHGSLPLVVGSSVQAKDYGEYWHPARIVEVDYDEMEVLVHYENVSKRHDEWISVNSSRLRPFDKNADRPSTSSAVTIPLISPTVVKQEPKSEESPKLMFVVGERCLARWRDGRRFIATVQSDLGNGLFEIIFDDGFYWKCNISRLSKLKGSGRDFINKDTNSPSTSQTPLYQAIPSPSTSLETGLPNVIKIPIFHTHLFDPARDYLGSKSERREKKRKLNIKEIFNIGQKRKRLDAPTKRVVKPIAKHKKLNVVKPVMKPIKKETKELPDAVASIIGTVTEVDNCGTKSNPGNIEAIKEENDQSADEIFEEHESVEDSEESETKIEIALELDPIEKEKIKLENFERQDDEHHEKVIDKIKEAINKLEDGINKVESQDDNIPITIPESIITTSEVVATTPEVLNTKPEVVPTTTLEVVPSTTPEVVPSTTPEVLPSTTPEVLDTTPEELITMADISVASPDVPVKSPEVPPEEENEEEDTISFNEIEVIPVTIELEEIEIPENVTESTNSEAVTEVEKPNKNVSKIKKKRKMRLLQERKVKKQVEKVKNELEEMKRQVEEMRKAMLMKSTEFTPNNAEMPESFLLPGEWCCKWVNGQPVGKVSEVNWNKKGSNKQALPRRSVQVEDKRLPVGWTKYMVRRSLGSSAGKWDILLVGPDKKRFYTRVDMRNYLDENESLKPYENALLDFGVHIKLAKRMGWFTITPDGKVSEPTAPMPIVLQGRKSPPKRPKISIKKAGDRMKFANKKRKRIISQRMPSVPNVDEDKPGSSEIVDSFSEHSEITSSTPVVEDGYVYVGSLKVEIIENLLRCPAEGCLKNFRNNTLLKMHIKHYHRELRKMLGSTPKVLDLAYARAKPNEDKLARQNAESVQKAVKIRTAKLPRHSQLSEGRIHPQENITSQSEEAIQLPLDSPKHGISLPHKPKKRPRVLLPVRRPEPEPEEQVPETKDEFSELDHSDSPEDQSFEPLDFETAISTHTVTKPLVKSVKKRKYFASVSKAPMSEEDEWGGINSDLDTRSSFPHSESPDFKMDGKVDVFMQPLSSESTEEQKDSKTYTYTENGERIKIVHMKREEIINCHCGVREEDGLMVQCELCLCWQHALCHNIQRESEVPEKYTCSICVNPRRGRRSQRFLHDQDRLYEGLLPGAQAHPHSLEPLRRAHELAGNLLLIGDALHALRLKHTVACKKDHPKLYLWAKDWETGELTLMQEKLNSDYSDLNIMISDIGKENLPIRDLDIQTLASDDNADRSLLSASALELTLSGEIDLDKLANSVQAVGPQPEAAIEAGACRRRLLRHVQRCHALVDARLDTIEAQVAELESQDPSFEDDETADYIPRTKQTIQMLMRDLDTLEELGLIT